MKNGQLLFSYYPDQRWLKSSAYINCSGATMATSAKPNARR
jgi:hypothetical protein